MIIKRFTIWAFVAMVTAWPSNLRAADLVAYLNCNWGMQATTTIEIRKGNTQAFDSFYRERDFSHMSTDITNRSYIVFKKDPDFYIVFIIDKETGAATNQVINNEHGMHLNMTWEGQCSIK